MAQNESVLSATCVLCSIKMGFLNGKIILKDGFVCNDCWVRKGLKSRINYMTESRNYTAKQIMDLVSTIENAPTNNSVFRTNTLIADLIQCDDTTQTVQIITKNGFNSAKEYIKYNQIVSFELIEDGETITKGGLGAAIVGHAMFGMGGAVVGSIIGKKKTKPICNSLQIRISVKDYYTKNIFVKYIETPTKNTSTIYKQMLNQSRKAISELQVAVSSVESASDEAKGGDLNSLADEIAKLRNLVEQGILTQEEYESAKKKLLS